MIEREAASGELVETRMCPLSELDEGKDAPLARLVPDRVKTQSGFPDGSGRGTFGHGTYFR